MDRRLSSANDNSDRSRDSNRLIRFESLRPEHARILFYLRSKDIEEANAISDIPIDVKIAWSIATSVMGYAAFINLDLCAVCGVCQNNDPWLVMTDKLEQHAVGFLRASIPVIREMKSRFDYLENWVSADNELSIKWLEWAGFEIDPPTPIYRGVFRRFHWKRGEAQCVRQ